MIGAAGFDMIDLGVDVPIEKFKEAIEANPDVKVVALSALLTIAVLLNVPFLFTFTLTQTLAVLPLAKLAIFQTILWESR